MTKRTLIAIDAGTTHCKAGLFSLEGEIVVQVGFGTPIRRSVEGYEYIDHEGLWEITAKAIADLAAHPQAGQVAGIGISGMAETGLLVDRNSGAACSRMIPWFDMSSAPQAEFLGRIGNREARFYESGLFPAYKCSLAKILWLRNQYGANTHHAVWLCAPDFLAYQLTGQMATDYSLAGRTYAFRIFEKKWDELWLRQFNLSSSNWPEVYPAGTLIGETRGGFVGIPSGIPVCIAGHDHVCAALAVGATRPGVVLDSIGTAESLMGAFPEVKPGKKEYESGFAFGCHIFPGMSYWLGGLSSAGGAVEWVRNLVGSELPYEQVISLLDSLNHDPGDILFLPYLAGSGTPHSEPAVRGAMIGLRATHRLADLFKAVLEGTTYEIEYMRQRAEGLLGGAIDRVIATGGGTSLTRWMQIKADVCGCAYEIAQTKEAVMLGAAMVAGKCAGIFGDLDEAFHAMGKPAAGIYYPDPSRHQQYRVIYERSFLKIQEPIRQLHREGF